MKKLLSLSAILTAVSLSSTVLAATDLPLNTGWNHGPNAVYPNTGAVGNLDQYWINIASYPPLGPPVKPAAYYGGAANPTPSAWIAALAGQSHWIGPNPSSSSSSSTNPNNPGYSIFRKCFCLQNDANGVSMNMSVRADDNVQVWFNTVTNNLIGPVAGNYGSSSPAHVRNNVVNGFHPGKNCLYVLVEDTLGGSVGFNLVGNVHANNGMMDEAHYGVDQTISPCACPAQPHIGGAAAQSAGARGAVAIGGNVDNEQATIQAIVKIAEERLAARKLQAPKK